MQPRELALTRLAEHLKKRTDALLQAVVWGRVRDGEAALEAVEQGWEVHPREQAMLPYVSRLRDMRDALEHSIAWSFLKDVVHDNGGRPVYFEVGPCGLRSFRPVDVGDDVSASPSQVVTERQVTRI